MARPEFEIDLPYQRKYMLQTKYQLTEEQFKGLYDEQNGRCAICRAWFNHPTNAHIDHDHETNKVRGLLCGKCNSGLGMFRDNICFLAGAIVYLESNGKTYRSISNRSREWAIEFMRC